MKNLKSILAKVFTAVAIVPIVSLSIVACTNGKKNNNSVDNAENQSQGNGNTDVNTNVGDNEQERVNSLNGFYTFSGDYSRSNLVYDTEQKQELLDFFGTRDLSGAYYKAERLGLKDFVKNITTFEDKSVNVLIRTSTDENADPESTNRFIYLVKGDDYTYSPLGEEKIHDIIVTENGYETADGDPIILYTQETNELNFIYQFTYVDESGSVVETPLYYKTTLTYDPFFDTNVLAEGNSYVFSNDSTLSVEIPEDLAETLTPEVIATEIAEKVSYTGEELTLEAINQYLHTICEQFGFMAQDNYAIGVIASKNVVRFITQNEDGTFDVNGLNYTLTFTEDGSQAIFTTTLDCGATMTITLTNLLDVSKEQDTETTVPGENAGDAVLENKDNSDIEG